MLTVGGMIKIINLNMRAVDVNTKMNNYNGYLFRNMCVCVTTTGEYLSFIPSVFEMI